MRTRKFASEIYWPLKRHLSVFHKCQICPEILKNKTFSNPYCSPCKKKYVPSVKVAKVSGDDYCLPNKPEEKNYENLQLGSETATIEEKVESKVLPDLCEKYECLAPLASPFPPKGKLISEWLFDVLNFPKKQHKSLMNFSSRI